jgi:hypothetical protein
LIDDNDGCIIIDHYLTNQSVWLLAAVCRTMHHPQSHSLHLAKIDGARRRKKQTNTTKKIAADRMI